MTRGSTSHAIGVNFYDAYCFYPTAPDSRILMESLGGISEGEALQACVNMRGGYCAFIWADNSGNYYMGRDLTWSDIWRAQEELRQTITGIKEQEERTTRKIIRNFR